MVIQNPLVFEGYHLVSCNISAHPKATGRAMANPGENTSVRQVAKKGMSNRSPYHAPAMSSDCHVTSTGSPSSPPGYAEGWWARYPVKPSPLQGCRAERGGHKGISSLISANSHLKRAGKCKAFPMYCKNHVDNEIKERKFLQNPFLFFFGKFNLLIPAR